MSGHLPGVFRALILGVAILPLALNPEVSVGESRVEDPIVDRAEIAPPSCSIENTDELIALTTLLFGEPVPINDCPNKAVDSQSACGKLKDNQALPDLERELCKAASGKLATCAETAGSCYKCKKGENLPQTPNATCKRDSKKPDSTCDPITFDAETVEFCVKAKGECGYGCK